MATIQGTAGDDSLVGTAGGDDFHMEQGGADTVSGGDGIDVFYFGASLGAGDSIDGGTGNDFLLLDGDYSAGLDLGTLSLSGVEEVQLTAGHSYRITGMTNANLSGGTIRVDGSALGASDHLRIGAIDVTAAHGASVEFDGGLGSDTLVGSAGSDTLSGGGAQDLIKGGRGDDTITAGFGDATLIGGSGSDTIGIGGGAVLVKGGAGSDHVDIPTLEAGAVLDGGTSTNDLDFLGLSGDHQSYELNGHNAINFEVIGTSAYNHLLLDAALVPKGETLELIGGLGSRIDGHLVRGDLKIIGGGGHDVLIGGSGDDTIVGGDFGENQIIGGKGGDMLTGAENADFIYKATHDSTVDNPDTITGLSRFQTIDLGKIDADTTTAGDQAFHLAASFSGHAGELVLAYDSFRDVTSISGDVNGDGVADFTINASGSHADFTSFVF